MSVMQPNPEFDSLIDGLLGKDSKDFLDGLKGDPCHWFRFNPLKFTLEFQRELLAREGFQAQAVEGFPNIWRVPREKGSASTIGKSLSHCLGNLYIQNLASMIPPLLLDPQPEERVLDLCSAPGSKTSMLASLMEGKGVLVANDRAKRRMQSLIFNLRRCGVPNVIFSTSSESTSETFTMNSLTGCWWILPAPPWEPWERIRGCCPGGRGSGVPALPGSSGPF